MFVQSFVQVQIYLKKILKWVLSSFLIVQAKVSRFPVNPDVFRVLLEKMNLYKQQKMKNHLKQTVMQNLQEYVSKTDVVIYFITLLLKLS